MSQSEGVYMSRAALLAGAAASQTRLCNCVGPQNGLPCCPCRAKNLTVENGHWIEKVDHGPVPSWYQPKDEK